MLSKLAGRSILEMWPVKYDSLRKPITAQILWKCDIFVCRVIFFTHFLLGFLNVGGEPWLAAFKQVCYNAIGAQNLWGANASCSSGYNCFSPERSLKPQTAGFVTESSLGEGGQGVFWTCSFWMEPGTSHTERALTPGVSWAGWGWGVVGSAEK